MKRSSGILMHISSLPNSLGIGTLGNEAFDFVDFLCEAGQSYWQILPLGPTGKANSPYQSYSAFAGNPLLIGLDKLVNAGLLLVEELGVPPVTPDAGKVDFEHLSSWKNQLLRKAFVRFRINFQHYKDDYYYFLGEHSWWLDDFALFCSIKAQYGDKCWNEWSRELVERNSHYLSMAFHKDADEIEFYRFLQFLFFKQWFELKNYANQKGISIFGDMPLYVALDSADVWSNQSIFSLDGRGKMVLSAGVPPDYFSDEGQLWGCPVFNWHQLEQRKYDWLLARLHFNLHLFDLIRIDHFRGLESFWAVPASEKNAIKGKWYPASGYQVLEQLQSRLGHLPVVAEDLGLITPEVDQLRDHFGLPGMKVLQFAYASDETDLNLPHNFKTNFVVYPGTHDNDTTVGWLKGLTGKERSNLQVYYPGSNGVLNRRVVEAAWASVAFLSVASMQDILELGSSARMNTPGTLQNNWIWRMDPKMLKRSQIEFLKEITLKYNRRNANAADGTSPGGRVVSDNDGIC